MNCILASLIVAGLAGIDVESGLDRPVKQVRLGESEYQVALAAAEAGVDGEGLAQAKKVVSAVAKPDKGAGKSANAARQSDAVLALFVDLEREINRAFFFIEVPVRNVGIVRLKLIEITELVQTQETLFPKHLVVDLAFFQTRFHGE